MSDAPDRTIAAIVGADLCIGCGLCESITAGRMRMEPTHAGSLRPTPLDAPDAIGALTDDEQHRLVAACPGAVAASRDLPAPHADAIWGGYRSMVTAWAADPDVRHRASSGGVLTALGQFALRSGRAAFVLHVGADPQRPARTQATISETPGDVLAGAGSRYGPAAPLARLHEALDRGEPFAVIAKPCDLGAIERLARHDQRVDRLCTTRLAMVCGGQSRFTKTAALLDRFGVPESAVARLSYRGDGNPGPTRVDTTDGATFETSYLELWADEAGWDLETRCKLCPDALGECADVAAADAWPGGAPTGDDEGFNAVVVRTDTGASLVRDAVAADAIVLGATLTPADLDRFQPHQVAKKEVLATRYEGVAAAGVPPIETIGLRVARLGTRFTGDRAAERAGTQRRIEQIMRSDR